MPQAELWLGVLVEGRDLRPSLGANYEYVIIYLIIYYFYCQTQIIQTRTSWKRIIFANLWKPFAFLIEQCSQFSVFGSLKFISKIKFYIVKIS